MPGTVIEVLRRFLPKWQNRAPVLSPDQKRAIRAIEHCRTSAMGAELYTCAKCGDKHFAFHNCNHKACPQCGKSDTVKWVERELGKLIDGVPYFMVNFTLPSELRSFFFGTDAKQAYDALFAVSSKALSEVLSRRKWLHADVSGFTGILHTWNQKLLFHPHVHYIVPGAGLDAHDNGVVSKDTGFLVPISELRAAYMRGWRQQVVALGWKIDPKIWQKTWGVYIKPFGRGANAVKYLGAYVCRTAIGDRRILEITENTVQFSWKDRSAGNKTKQLTLKGEDFVERYLRHVLPRGMRSIRYYGFCHPAAVKKRCLVHAACGGPCKRAETSDEDSQEGKSNADYKCSRCGEIMEHTHRLNRDGKLFALRKRGPPEVEEGFQIKKEAA